MLHRREALPVTAASVILVAVVIADATTARGTVLVSLVVTAPLLTAAFTRPGVTAAVAVGAILAALVRLPFDGTDGVNDTVRIASITASSTLAVLIAGRREERERQLAQMTQVAEVAQNAVLWPVPERVRHLRLSARYVSATAAARIGGDLYEVVESTFGVRIIIGDVRGKGLPAVRLAAAVLGCFRQSAYDRVDLRDVLTDLDATVARLASPEDFVTAAVLQLDGDRGQILLCGHPAPLLSGGVTTLDLAAADLPFGLGAGDGSLATAFTLPPGGRLLLHTDGLLEARNRAGVFFPAGECFAELATQDTTDVLDGLLKQLTAWCGGHLADDVALLLVERPA